MQPSPTRTPLPYVFVSEAHRSVTGGGERGHGSCGERGRAQRTRAAQSVFNAGGVNKAGR
jgi:hypothetical protein